MTCVSTHGPVKASVIPLWGGDARESELLRLSSVVWHEYGPPDDGRIYAFCYTPMNGSTVESIDRVSRESKTVFAFYGSSMLRTMGLPLTGTWYFELPAVSTLMDGVGP